MSVETATGQPRRTEALAIDGFLIVDKPPGITSTDVVRRVKRLTGARKVGHGGTLDPDARGVLLLCLGQATRFADSALHGAKEYTMTGRLGAATDTYDAAGQVTVTADAAAVTRSALEEVLPRFRGQIQQVPPMFSALKHEGRRLYRLAREGIEIERSPRLVTVHRLELREWAPPEFVLEAECGRGFYARSLVHDIGVALANAAHLSALTRSRTGPFTLENATPLDQIGRGENANDWMRLLYPVDLALEELRAMILDPLQQERVQHGQALNASGLGRRGAEAKDREKARAYDREGRMIAVLEFDASGFSWRPHKVLPSA